MQQTQRTEYRVQTMSFVWRKLVWFIQSMFRWVIGSVQLSWLRGQYVQLLSWQDEAIPSSSMMHAMGSSEFVTQPRKFIDKYWNLTVWLRDLRPNCSDSFLARGHSKNLLFHYLISLKFILFSNPKHCPKSHLDNIYNLKFEFLFWNYVYVHK